MTIPLVGSGSGIDVQQSLANVLTANGIPAIHRACSSDALPQGIDVAVECDSSIQQGESKKWQGISWCPVEIKTKILTGVDDWESIVPKTLSIASYLGARVNTTCGHHIHIEVPEIPGRPRIIRSIYALHYKFQNIIFGLVSPSRHQYKYARPLSINNRILRSHSLPFWLQQQLFLQHRGLQRRLEERQKS